MNIEVSICKKCKGEVFATKYAAGSWIFRCKCLGYSGDIIVTGCFDIDQAKKMYEDRVKNTADPCIMSLGEKP